MPGLLRTRLGQRPGVADHARRAARRRVGRQRPEGVDQLRAVRDAVRAAHPHRRRRTRPTRGDHRVLRRHGHPGHHRAAAAHHARRRRVLRGVLRRRRGARRPHARQARRRLAAGDGSAALRTLDLLLAAHRLPVLAVRRADRRGQRRSAQAADSDLGDAYLALHTLRCRSRATQHRLGRRATSWVRTPRSTRCCWPAPNRQLYDTARDLLPGAIELDDTAWRTEYLYSRAATIYGGTAEVQRNIIARRLLDLGKE